MPNIGQFVLHSMANPPIKAGDYVLQGRQDVAGGPTAPYDGHVRITSPRFLMPPDQILSTFPPANSEGAYENRLPQIVLKRRTLPWERSAEAGNNTTPWLALVVIAEGEGTLSADVPIAQCATPVSPLSGPNDVATGVYLAVSKTVVGVGTRFVGELSGDEDVLVDGRFEGKIHVQRTVSIGPTAELEADVQARHVIVGGRVKGQILAEERAELMSSAVVHGSVQAPKIVIAEGARLEGSVAMASSDSTEDEPIRKD